jgi:hypothetical protein
MILRRCGFYPALESAADDRAIASSTGGLAPFENKAGVDQMILWNKKHSSFKTQNRHNKNDD